MAIFGLMCILINIGKLLSHSIEKIHPKTEVKEGILILKLGPNAIVCPSFRAMYTYMTIISKHLSLL